MLQLISTTTSRSAAAGAAGSWREGSKRDSAGEQRASREQACRAAHGGTGTGPGFTSCVGKIGAAAPATPELPVPPDPFAIVRSILNAILAIIKGILQGMIMPVLDPIMAIIQFVLSGVVEALLLGGAQSLMSSMQDLAAMAAQLATAMAK